MTVQLQVHDIGRADDPTATTRTTHADAHAARIELPPRFGLGTCSKLNTTVTKITQSQKEQS